VVKEGEKEKERSPSLNASAEGKREDGKITSLLPSSPRQFGWSRKGKEGTPEDSAILIASPNH